MFKKLIASLAVLLATVTACQEVKAQPYWRTNGYTGGAITTPITAPTTADCSAPSYSITGDTDTGVTSTAANTWVTCTGGTARITTNTASTTFTLPILAADGTAAAPSYAFSSAPTYGMYLGAGGALRFSIAGAQSTLMQASELMLLSNSHSLIYGSAQDLYIKRYAAKQLSITGDGTGATTNAGWILGYSGTSGAAILAPSTVTPSGSINTLYGSAGATYISSAASSGSVNISPDGSNVKQTWSSTAGAGPAITAGTAATAVHGISITQATTTGGTGANALNILPTWNANAAASTAIFMNLTDTSSHASSLLVDLQKGSVSQFNISKAGVVSSLGYVNTRAGFAIDSAAFGDGKFGFYNSAGSQLLGGSTYRWSASSSDANTAADTGLSRVSAGVVGVGTGAAASTAGTIHVTQLNVGATPATLTASGGGLVAGGAIVAGGNVTVPTGANSFYWTSASRMTSPSDGVILLQNTAAADFTRLQFGGTTSSFPALRRTAVALDVVDATGAGWASLNSGALTVQTGVLTLGSGSSLTMSANVMTRTAPTIASGGCTSPAVTWNNGTAAFLLTVGTACTAVKTIVLTLPAATNLWACQAANNTSDAQQASNIVVARATSTTAVTLTNYARTTGLASDLTASDTILVSCMGG